jgi:hypothetical protein
VTVIGIEVVSGYHEEDRHGESSHTYDEIIGVHPEQLIAGLVMNEYYAKYYQSTE